MSRQKNVTKNIPIFAKMKILQSKKLVLSTLLLAVYIFVAFFAANLHQHGSGLVFKDFHFKTSEKSVKTSHHQQEFTDCLSCHLVHDGKNLIPQEFSFLIFTEVYFQKQVFAYQQRFSSLTFHTLQLRGPPFFI